MGARAAILTTDFLFLFYTANTDPQRELDTNKMKPAVTAQGSSAPAGRRRYDEPRTM